MEDDEVPDALVLEVRPPVELVDVDGIEATRGKEAGEADDDRLNEVDAGRLERLEEAARKTDRHAVLVPQLAALAREELDVARGTRRSAVESRQENRGRLVVGDVLARVHVAIADAML